MTQLQGLLNFIKGFVKKSAVFFLLFFAVHLNGQNFTREICFSENTIQTWNKNKKFNTTIKNLKLITYQQDFIQLNWNSSHTPLLPSTPLITDTLPNNNIVTTYGYKNGDIIQVMCVETKNKNIVSAVFEQRYKPKDSSVFVVDYQIKFYQDKK